jgi:SAM-dependent methyltransferase
MDQKMQTDKSNASVFSTQGLWYSLRRHFVDQFQLANIKHFTGRVIDIGGNKTKKRGLFNIEKYDLDVVYANYVTDKEPDVQADPMDLPFRDASFDSALCAELLEHVRNPERVVHEAFRVLRPGGMLMGTVPFMMKIHGDPSDYGRYTSHYWQELLAEVGFENVVIEKQGGVWCVLVDILRDIVCQRHKEKEFPFPFRLRGLPAWLNFRLQRRINRGVRRSMTSWCEIAIRRDHRPDVVGHASLGGYTTGYGILAKKPNDRDE